MSFLNLEQLPFVGMSYEFVGEKQGAPFSAYIVSAKPGQGPPLHTHPYVEVAFTLEGAATITVGDDTREVKSLRIRRTVSLTRGTRFCVRLISTPAQDSFKRTLAEDL
jgi:oxalate decarboxylase/phosphoglucose isomerase-like protein (cupin superfamily)